MSRTGEQFNSWRQFSEQFDNWRQLYEAAAPTSPQGRLLSMQRLYRDPLWDDQIKVRANCEFFAKRIIQFGMRDQELETIRQNTTELSQYSSELLQTYYLQTAILEPIINTLPDKLKVRLGDILITVIPIRSVNAAVIKLDSTFVIAVDTGLLHLLSYFHEIQVTSAMLGDKARGEQYLKAKCRFICEYYNRGGLVSFPDPDSQFKLTPAAAHMIVAQTLACEICLICHEIAHIMCGHLNQRKMTRLPMVGQQGGKQIPLAYTHKHTQEFQADFIGYRLYRSIFHKFDALNTHGD